jgi:hypothetical protein
MYRADTSEHSEEGPMLELAVLGLLQEAPMHGYELRKELATKLGTIRAAISFGTLYPTLKRLQTAGWISTADPADLGVHFAFFARTDRATRLRILEGRRRRVEERREGLREVLARASDRLDAYTLELQRHGLDACEREVRWLEELITNERSGRPPAAPAGETPPEPPRPHQDRP